MPCLKTHLKTGCVLESLAPLLIAGLVFVVYLNSFSGPFIFDDFIMVHDNRSIRCLWPLTTPLSPPHEGGTHGRPVVNLSYAINYAFGGLDARGYHAGNLFLHILVALVLYGVVRRTLAGERFRATYGYHATGLAMTAALIWSVHPLTTGSVSYIAARSEILMSLFYVLTLYCVIRGVDSPRGKNWTVAAVVACALGMASKEVMVSAPLIVLLYDRIFLAGSFREALRRRWGLYVGLAATWAVLMALLAGIAFNVKRGGGAPFTVWEYARTQSEVIMQYLRLSLWPRPLVLDYYDWTVAHLSLALVASLVVVLGLLTATVEAVLSRRPIGFLGACFFLILAPTSSFLPLLGEVATERRMYLPLATVVVLVVIVVWKALEAVTSRWMPAIFAGLVVAILGAFTVQRNEDYRSGLAIWSDTAAKRPNNARALTETGTALVELGRFPEAIGYFERATRIQPDYAMAYSNWGVALAMQGRLDEAIGKLLEAVQRNPASAFARFNLGLVLEKQGHPQQAAIQYQSALQIDPYFTKARDGLVRLHQLRG
ncbi:MAG: tetratricopeptide repeat protein [Verrucomicrobiia bacterium]